MKITRLTISNYRSLEDVELDFSQTYSTISGRNNAGKSNVFRVIQYLFGPDTTRHRFRMRNPLVSFQDDFPFWKREKDSKAPIEICCTIKIFRDQDSGLFHFIERFLKKPMKGGGFVLTLKKVITSEKDEASTLISVGDEVLEPFDAELVEEKLTGSPTIIFHNSPQHPTGQFAYSDSFSSFLSEFTQNEREEITAINKHVRSKLRKLAKRQEEEIGKLLGRMEEKYEVAITLPDMNVDYMPFDISLSDKSVEVSLDDWGSGTRNRTLVLLSILKARQLSQVQNSPSGLTPVVLIEEPECFLHHSAQAEFGRVLRDLAEELDVQVIVTTHSPYMLNLSDSSANILLCRKVFRNKPKETLVTDTTGEQWMTPFAEALGLLEDDLSPLRELFFSGDKAILLVEGTTDKEYFEMLRSEEHGENRLKFEGEIFPYGGKDVLKNTVLLRFIQERHNQCIITVDLDAVDQVSKSVEGLGFIRDTNYFPIGVTGLGKDCVEGLLPDSIRSVVLSENADLSNRLIYADGKDKRKAKDEFKKACLDKFKASAKPNTDDFKEFYKLAKKLNKTLKD